MRIRTARIVVTAGTVALSFQAAQAGTLTLRFENDVFYKSDREYTSGQGFTWTDDANTDSWATHIARWLPMFPQNADVRASYSLDQAIFTPRNTAAVNPPLTQRPYAGWLFTTLGIDSQTDHRLSQYSLDVGVVGPWALGEQAQNFVHSLRGFDLANGWHYQLHNEPGIELNDQQSWRYWLSDPDSKIGIDVIPHAGGAIGNVYDYLDAGGVVRVGRLTKDWTPARIYPAIPGTNIADDWGAYVFAGVEGRAVGRNIFLDGNSFQNSRSVDKYPFVADGELGAAVTLWHVRFAYTHVFLTREYKTQGAYHQYGTISVTARL
jgi:hypothetical protein